MKDPVDKMFPVTFDLLALVLGVIFFGSLGFVYFEVHGLRSDLARLNAKIELIENDQTRTRQLVTHNLPVQMAAVADSTPEQTPAHSMPTAATSEVKTQKRAKKSMAHGTSDASEWNQNLIKMLKQINQNEEPKKVYYHAGSVVVLDATITADDPFFEVLGFLLDEERYVRIELPKKLNESPLKKGLISFGIMPDSIKAISGPNIRIIVRE